MSKIKIGIQGGRGSFSEEAAKIFSNNHGINNYEIIYLISSDMVLKNVELQTADYGVFAMENAQGGVVIESIEALAKYRGLQAGKRYAESFFIIRSIEN